jgi:NADH-quinone oxidoreductase subunit M
MVALTAGVVPLALLGSWDQVTVRTPTFGALLLLVVAGFMGVYLALDLLVFYLAWELMLIPTYLLLGVWGIAGGAAGRAALRYVLYTLVGSLLMLVAIVYLASQGDSPSLHLDALRQLALPPGTQVVLFLAFFSAFAVKSALVPFHSWLPEAQVTAPTVTAVTLGLKVGVFALLRFAMPLFPAALIHPVLQRGVLILSTVAILYGAFVALGQKDLKRIIAFSAISHAGYILMGCFVLTPQAMQGAVVSVVGSGLATTALLLLASRVEDHLGTTSLDSLGGLAHRQPWFAATLVIAILSTVALPGTVGFVGEFLVLLGTFAEEPVLATVATGGVVFAAAYGLRLVQGVVLGPVAMDAPGHPVELRGRERTALGLLIFAMLALGIGPAGLIHRIAAPTAQVIEAVRFAPAVASAPERAR